MSIEEILANITATLERSKQFIGSDKSVNNTPIKNKAARNFSKGATLYNSNSIQGSGSVKDSILEEAADS